MTRASQKTTERAILDGYLDIRGLTGRVVDGPEPPDFLVDLDGEVVGMEVVEYHQPQRTTSGHTRREVEAAWEAIRQYVVEYREDRSELDGLSVRLQFTALNLPSRHEIPVFVEAVTDKISAARPQVGQEWTYLRPSAGSPTILVKYLRTIGIREAGCYLEWDWNHDFGGVGTSDEEMMAVAGPKLTSYRPPKGIKLSHLIIAGGGRWLSQIAAPWSTEQLSGFGQLNAALEASQFDEVALLCLRTFVWTRGEGWRQLGEQKE